MGAVLGDVLGFAAGVAVSPLPIIAVILTLATPRGRLNGILFTVGWLLGLSVLGAVILAVASPAHKHPSAWVGALKLALGLLLLFFGGRQWRRRPKDPSQARLPKWMGAIDRLTPVKVFGLGTALAALNAKNAPLTIAAGAAIGSAGLPVGQQIASLAIFVVIATLGLLVPLGVFLFGGERARTTLGNWKDWAAQHNVAVMAVLLFVLGLKLLGDGISIITS
jgi:threonine/homoserine/homoserine lactone efflux protein